MIKDTPMTKNDIVSFIQQMIRNFYQSSDQVLLDKIANSKSFEDLELTPLEITKLIMSCEERFGVDLGEGNFSSIQELIDKLSEFIEPEGDKLPDPPAEISVPETPAEGDEVVEKASDESEEKTEEETTEDTSSKEE